MTNEQAFGDLKAALEMMERHMPGELVARLRADEVHELGVRTTRGDCGSERAHSARLSSRYARRAALQGLSILLQFQRRNLRRSAHIPVRGEGGEGGEAKFWVSPDVRVVDSNGFDARNLRKLTRVVETCS